MQSGDNWYKYVMMCTPRCGSFQVVMYLYSEEVCLQPNSLTSTVSPLAEDARVDTAALVGCGSISFQAVQLCPRDRVSHASARHHRRVLRGQFAPPTNSFKSIMCLEKVFISLELTVNIWQCVRASAQFRKNKTEREEVENIREMGKLKNMKQKRSNMNNNILTNIKKIREQLGMLSPCEFHLASPASA